MKRIGTQRDKGGFKDSEKLGIRCEYISESVNVRFLELFVGLIVE